MITSRMKPDVKDFKTILLKYAQSQALRDPRLAKDKRISFKNFSLILTFGASNAQVEHIDLLAPGYQFGLILCDKCPSTSFLLQEGISDITQLAHAVFGREDLVKLFLDNKDAEQLIRDYGAVLQWTQEKLVQVKDLARGSLCSLAGSIKHAGPACRDSRAVLFFSGRHEGEGVDYNPDVQYSRSSLCQQLLALIWGDATKAQRQFLLELLARYMKEERKYNETPWAHFPEEFVEHGKQLADSSPKKRRHYIGDLVCKPHFRPKVARAALNTNPRDGIDAMKLIDLGAEPSCAGCAQARGSLMPLCSCVTARLSRRALVGCHGCNKAFRCLDIHNEGECIKSQCSIWGAQKVCVEETTARVGTTARILLEKGAFEMWLLRRLWGVNKTLRTFLGNLCFRRLCELSPTILFDQARVVGQEEIRAFFSSVKDLEEGW